MDLQYTIGHREWTEIKWLRCRALIGWININFLLTLVQPPFAPPVGTSWDLDRGSDGKLSNSSSKVLTDEDIGYEHAVTVHCS